ncbi:MULTISPECIES: hypothetical protein [Bacillus]|nr:hypothetical protein [Bacillus safensis]UXC34172.1 hypothetical protein N4Q31_08965 [Bacillus safensis]
MKKSKADGFGFVFKQKFAKIEEKECLDEQSYERRNRPYIKEQ